MNIQNDEFHIEVSQLAKVVEIIREQVKELRQYVEEGQADVTAIRRNFWTDISVNMANLDDILETNASIAQQSMSLANQERTAAYTIKQLRKLEKLEMSPYFSRIDFTEQGSREVEALYIGLGSVVDEATGEHLVYDWRAPVAGMFYDYGIGHASYKTPVGTMEGDISLKRQYVIRRSELQTFFNTGVHIGDEVLQGMLGQSADDRMKTIVTTIQREQNQIIRDEEHKVLIVQGAAGSGKTSAALQRIAYLLYKHRSTLNPDQMVLITPNALFGDYVSMVLPELGETNVQQTTFQGYLEKRLGADGSWVLEDAYDQLEELLNTENEASYQVKYGAVAFKASLGFIGMINRYVTMLALQDMKFKPLMYRGKAWASEAELTKDFYETYRSMTVPNRIEAMQRKLGKAMEKMGKAELARVYAKLHQRPEYGGTDAEMLEQARRMVRKHLRPLKEQVKQLAFVDVYALYERLFRDETLAERLLAEALDGAEKMEAATWKAYCERTLTSLTSGRVLYEDATPLMYLREKLEGFMAYRTIRYVVVDEAQDYSPFQLEVLRNVFPRARLTFLGDLNQGIYAHTRTDSYAQALRIFGETETSLLRLTKSYRSTREIMAFAGRLLPHAEPVEPFARSGAEPRLVQAPGDGAALAVTVLAELAAMRAAGARSCAVLCRTARESEEACALLQREAGQAATSAAADGIRLVTKAAQTFSTGTLVLPVYLAKGLEFDAVVVWNSGATHYFRENERKLLYTASTRALHQLSVCYTGELSPLISAGN
jgi:DNA helicase-2/ATP-dependent DNA helicase PcrA